jgi:parvulin-like peptidyl-prolyl isomerase
MIAQVCGRRLRLSAVAVAALAVCGNPGLLSAQTGRPTRGTAGQPAPTASDQKIRLEQQQPVLAPVAIPVNPSDPIAIVNGEVITRAQVSDETIARHGKEILDALIARKLIDQDLKRKKLEVTAAEIDQEIDDVAQRLAGVGRQAWLMSLEKEKGISPLTYAHEIIYPTIALRKLASGQVQVTEQDMNDAFEAHFGARLYCRIISVAREREAIDIWEKLKNNPGGFEALAKERSTDTATRGLGGLLSEPIARHAFPRTVSDAAFLQLVDGDPKDTDPTHKPKDGDISGVIQINQTAWVIIKREQIDPAKNFDRNDPTLKAQLYQQMYDAKIKDEMTKVFNRLTADAEIDNRLTGQAKIARQDQHPEYQQAKDAAVRQVQRTGGAAAPAAPGGAGRTPAGGASSAPVGLPADVASQAERLRQSPSQPK